MSQQTLTIISNFVRWLSDTTAATLTLQVYNSTTNTWDTVLTLNTTLSNEQITFSKAFSTSCTPVASATQACLLLGPTAISGGNANGTIIGANSATAYAGDIIDIQQNSVIVYQVASVASAVNGIKVALAATGTTPSIAAIGSDASIGLNITPKGTAGVAVNLAPPASATVALLQLGATAIAGGSASGTALGANMATAYAGDMIDLQQNSVIVYQVASVASAVNGIQVQLAATTNAPAISAIGSDAAINLNLAAKGAGFVNITGSPPASAVKALLTLGTTAIAGGNAAGTYLGANAATAYAGDLIDLQQNSVLVYQVASVASAVNGIQVQLTATGSAPQIAPIGSDTNIGLKLIGKGTGFPDIFGFGLANVSKSALYTATGADSTILTTATSAYTITLPQGAAYKDKAFAVVKDNAGANAITVTPASGTINGAANFSLASGAYHGVLATSDGTNYWIISSY